MEIHDPAEFWGDLPAHIACLRMISADDLAALQAAAQPPPAPLLIAGQPATQAAIDALVAYQASHP